MLPNGLETPPCLRPCRLGAGPGSPGPGPGPGPGCGMRLPLALLAPVGPHPAEQVRAAAQGWAGWWQVMASGHGSATCWVLVLLAGLGEMEQRNAAATMFYC